MILPECCFGLCYWRKDRLDVRIFGSICRRGLGREMLRSRLALAGIVWVACASWVLASGQKRVDEADCVDFGAEKAELDKTGIAEDLEKGADWGKDNLSPQRLKQIERYLYIDERLTFRCPNVLAAAAVRQMEEQARLKALAALERERLWLERMKKIPSPERKPETLIARAKGPEAHAVPPLPERKSR